MRRTWTGQQSLQGLGFHSELAGSRVLLASRCSSRHAGQRLRQTVATLRRPAGLGPQRTGAPHQPETTAGHPTWLPTGHPVNGVPAASNGSTGRPSAAASVEAKTSFPFTLHQLLMLKTVASARSMESAGEVLSVSKANVSTMLGKLERELGVQLYNRATPAGKGAGAASTQLTIAGRLLLRYAERLLALAADIRAVAHDAAERCTGMLRLGASQTTGVYVVPGLLERFQRAHPEVTLQLQVDNTRRCCRDVAAGCLDLALVGGAIPPDLGHLLQVTPYAQEEVVLVVGPSHPLAGAGTITPAQLAGLPFVSLHRSSTVAGIRTCLEEHGIAWKRLHVVLEVNSVEAIKAAVEEGMGAAFVSAAACSKEAEAGRLAVLRIEGVPLARSLRLVTDPTRYCSRAVRALIRLLFGEEASAERDPPATSSAAHHAQGGALVAGGLGPSGALRRYPGLQGRQLAMADMTQLRWHDPVDEDDHNSRPGSSGGLMPEAGGAAQPGDKAERLPFTLAQLVVLRTVARTGSFKAAALALGVTQPAVSKSITALEQVFGAPLVARGNGAAGHRALLTELGTALAPHCDSMIAVAREACRALAELASAASGCVSLGASQTTGTYLMPRLIAAFRQRHPGVTVQLQVDKSRRIAEAVASGELDLAIIGGEIPPDLRDALQVRPYARDELVLIVPPNHEMAGRSPIDKEDLYGLTFVSLNQGSTTQAAQEATLRAHGISWRHLNIDMEFNSVEAIKSAVHWGLGAAFVSVAAIEKELQLGLAQRLDIRGVRLTRTLTLVANPHRRPSAAAARFHSTLLAAVPGARVLLPVSQVKRKPWEYQTRQES